MRLPYTPPDSFPILYFFFLSSFLLYHFLFPFTYLFFLYSFLYYILIAFISLLFLPFLLFQPLPPRLHTTYHTTLLTPTLLSLPFLFLLSSSLFTSSPFLPYLSIFLLHRYLLTHTSTPHSFPPIPSLPFLPFPLPPLHPPPRYRSLFARLFNMQHLIFSRRTCYPTWTGRQVRRAR